MWRMPSLIATVYLCHHRIWAINLKWAYKETVCWIIHLLLCWLIAHTNECILPEVGLQMVPVVRHGAPCSCSCVLQPCTVYAVETMIFVHAGTVWAHKTEVILKFDAPTPRCWRRYVAPASHGQSEFFCLWFRILAGVHLGPQVFHISARMPQRGRVITQKPLLYNSHSNTQNQFVLTVEVGGSAYLPCPRLLSVYICRSGSHRLLSMPPRLRSRSHRSVLEIDKCLRGPPLGESGSELKSPERRDPTAESVFDGCCISWITRLAR